MISFFAHSAHESRTKSTSNWMGVIIGSLTRRCSLESALNAKGGYGGCTSNPLHVAFLSTPIHICVWSFIFSFVDWFLYSHITVKFPGKGCRDVQGFCIQFKSAMYEYRFYGVLESTARSPICTSRDLMYLLGIYILSTYTY